MSTRLARVRLRADIIELVLMRASVEEIADVLDMSREAVQLEIARAERFEEAADKRLRGHLRAQQHERLEDLIEALTPHALGDEDEKPDAAIVGRLLQAYKRQADLHGLDAPERREIELAAIIGLEGVERMTEEQLQATDALVAHVLNVVPEDSEEAVDVAGLLPAKAGNE